MRIVGSITLNIHCLDGENYDVRDQLIVKREFKLGKRKENPASLSPFHTPCQLQPRDGIVYPTGNGIVTGRICRLTRLVNAGKLLTRNNLCHNTHPFHQ